MHRVGGPCLIVPGEYREWKQYGLLHREDGPAKEWDDGSFEYLFRGRRHRDDGPAVVYLTKNHFEGWFRQGLRHRDDGPAITREDNFGIHYEWWVDGERLPDLDAKYSPGGACKI